MRNYDRVEDGMSVDPEDAMTSEQLLANYLADDGTVRCGLCDRRVLNDGRCPDCDDANADAEEPEECFGCGRPTWGDDCRVCDGTDLDDLSANLDDLSANTRGDFDR